MFREMRAALGIPKSVDILEHIQSLSTVIDSTESESQTSPRIRAVEAIRNIERKAMTEQIPQPGLVELMDYLDQRKIRKALCTRNFPMPVMHLLTSFLPGHEFDPIITRETAGIQPKPSPEGLWRIAEKWGIWNETINERNSKTINPLRDEDPATLAKKVLGAGLIMVGDSVDDMAAGRRAGSATVLLRNEDNEHVIEMEMPDQVIDRLDELVDMLEEGFLGKC